MCDTNPEKLNDGGTKGQNSKINFLPSVGEPNVELATEALLPLLLDWLKENGDDTKSSDLLSVEQTSSN